MVTMLQLINHVGYGFDVSRMVILALKVSLAVDSQKKFGNKELEALLDEDPTRTQEELADTFRVTQEAVSVRLKSMGMIQKQGDWVPYELKSRGAGFAPCQRSVQCSKIGENLLGNAEMGGLTPPAVLFRRYSLQLSFVSIDGTRLGSSAIPLL